MRRQLRLIAVLATLAAALVAGAAGASGNSGGGSVYVVEPGDTLWGISQRYGLTVDQLATANGLNPSGVLLIGRQLIIPPPAGSPTGGESVQAGPGSGPLANCPASAPAGPTGVLPAGLEQSPERLALQPLFVTWASHYDLSLPLLEAIGWQESGWQESAVSATGALGVGQIMPATAAFISDDLIGEPMDIRSVSDNIRMSAAFLAYLAGVERNNLCATIAAYYEGPLNLAAYGVLPIAVPYVADVEALIPQFE